MAKVNVKVCLGTTCFVMGSSNLQELMDLVPKKYGDAVLFPDAVKDRECRAAQRAAEIIDICA